jgi:prepilin-type N-terminal cleavage/methylation domain-containing protein
MTGLYRLRPNSKRGLSLLELSISIAIAASVAILAIRKNLADLRAEQLRREGDWVAGVLSDIQDHLGNSADFTSLNDLRLGALKSVPPEYLDKSINGTTKVVNGIGGSVHVGPLNLDGTNSSYALKYTGLSPSVCSNLAVMFYANAKARNVRLYGMVGSYDVAAKISAVGLINGEINVTTPDVVLQKTPDAGLDLSKVGEFCDGAGVAGAASAAKPRSLTLIRRP